DFASDDALMIQVFVKDAAKPDFFVALNITQLTGAHTENLAKPFHLEWEDAVDDYVFGFERI
ncbi:hypothetical protein COX85_01790, partial [Candidatus Micrarchaeota archaeon CG_4_10_14_0_2_um_filter_55_9]